MEPLNDSPDPTRDTFIAIRQLEHELTRLRQLAATAITALHHETNRHDSHRTTASGRATDTGGSSESTRPEAAVLRRLGDPDNPGPTTELWQIYDYVICARDATRHATRLARDAIDRNAPNPTYLTAAEKRRLYCTDPSGCHDYATTDGLCERHIVERRARWANERRQRRHRK